ncbi:helix-turn-helix domain-containing protein [Amorphus sp. MBR-141]
MTFMPEMTSTLEGISVLEDLRWRRWNGVIADVWYVACAEGACGEYVSKNARLFVLLEKEGGDFHVTTSPRGPEVSGVGGPAHLSFVPAGLPLWSRTEQAKCIRHLDLHFDVATLAERLGEDLDPERLQTPNLMFFDERLLALARLIAAECTGPDLHHDLYGDGLTLALFIDLMGIGRAEPANQPQLASWQLRRATEFIEENCLRNIRLEELAELTQLSQSYFSRAFKVATGSPPHQWHMKARIRKVQEMLCALELPLTEIAVAAGFADQAHFTRVFRRIVGTTPAAWRRAHRT